MPKSITVSDEAYEALQGERHEGETVSAQLLRLVGPLDTTKKDPMAFARRPHRMLMSPDEHLRMIEKDRDADRVA